MGKVIKQPHGGAIFQADKGETKNPNGRPRKGFKAFLHECREKGYEQVSLAEVVEAYQYLMGLPVSDVMAIAGDPLNEKRTNDTTNQHPALIRRVAAEMMGKRGQEMLKQVLDRAFGQSVEKSESETKMVMTTRYVLDDGTVLEL